MIPLKPNWKKIINSAKKKKLKVLILILMSLNDFTMIAIINILVKQQTVTLFQWWCIISYQMMLTTLHKSSTNVWPHKRMVTWKPSVITIILAHHWQSTISQRLVTCRQRNVHTSITIISSFSFFIYIDISAVLFGGKKQTLAVRGLPFLH